MTNLDAILEIAIGIILTWLILSVATVEVQNIINALLNRRAKFLEKSLLDMFNGEQSIVDQFYEHPAIKALYKKNILGKKIKPDYIPSEAFGEAALEIFIQLGEEEDKTAQAIANLEAITQNPQLDYFVKRLFPEADIQSAAIQARKVHTKAISFKKNAENWFDSSMTKASFWYKERAKLAAFIIGLLLASLFNVDSLKIVDELWREPTLRQSLVAQAQTVDESGNLRSVQELEAHYQELKLPVGWSEGSVPADGKAWTFKVFGLLISGLAAMQGAPFWFDILKKMINVKDGKTSSSGSTGDSGGSVTLPPSAPRSPEEDEAVG